MKPHSLSEKGLSMTQAQSVSNLAYQKASDIQRRLDFINNATKKINFGEKVLTSVAGNPLPTNVVELLTRRAKLHSVQAFLMENIKAKDKMLKDEKAKEFVFEEDFDFNPEYLPLPKLESNVDEDWGWSQLSTKEFNEYVDQQAIAAHIGKFIHENGKLDSLRKELPNIPTIEWTEKYQSGGISSIPVEVIIHHSADQLEALHVELSDKHRAAEQRVNYFKAKVLNLISDKNAEISRNNANLIKEVETVNATRREEWNSKYNAYLSRSQAASKQFQAAKAEEVKRIASLRIGVDPRFKEIIDELLPSGK